MQFWNILLFILHIIFVFIRTITVKYLLEALENDTNNNLLTIARRLVVDT